MKTFIFLFTCILLSSSAQLQGQNKDRTYIIEVDSTEEAVTFNYVVNIDNSEIDGVEQFQTSSLDTFLLLLTTDLVAIQNKKSLLFYIHGMMAGQKQYFAHTIKELNDGYVDADESDIARLISIRWPGNNPVYKKSKKNAHNIAPALAELLATIITECNAALENNLKMVMLAHSLGTELFKEILLHWPKSDIVPFGNVILVGSDLEIDVFEEEGELSNIGLMSDHTSVYYSTRDFTLSFSKSLNKRTRLGLFGPSELTVPSEQVTYIDVTEIRDEKPLPLRMVGHSYFKASPTVMKDILYNINGFFPEGYKNRTLLDTTFQKYKLSETPTETELAD